MGTKFRLGDTIVEIVGDHPVADLVRRELEPVSVNTSTSDIGFIITENPLPKIPANAKCVGPVFALPDKAWIHFDSIGYRTLIAFNHHTMPSLDIQVQLLPYSHKNIPTFVRRWRNWTYLTPWEQRAYSFINGILESTLLFFSKSTSLLHASVVEKEGCAICFPSTGGIGKTTVSLQLVVHHGFRWMADDIALIVEDGRVSLNPRYIMIYPYNLQGLSTLSRTFFRQRNLFDRIHWMIKASIRGPKGVRRRVPPEMLFGARLAKTAHMGQIFFLARCPVLDFQLEDISPHKLAEMCTNIILAEYSYYVNYLYYWESTGFAPITVGDLRVRLAHTYERAFSKAIKCQLVRIPVSATPVDLRRFIMKVIEDD